jgi:O-antigen/teichoic acid export membrane protein
MSNSISTRFAFSFIYNGLRAILTLSVGILIARTIGPDEYGRYQFLLGSFIAFCEVLNLGTSQAYFTFLSENRKERRFFKYYFYWQTFQYVLPLVIIAFILSDELLHLLWQGESRGTILVAFSATFLIQRGWYTVVSIGESERKTKVIQAINTAVSFVYLTVIIGMIWLNIITVMNIFILIIVQYSISIIFTYRMFVHAYVFDAAERPKSYYVKKFWTYCSPLIVVSVITFIYQYSDKWLLQRYAGSTEQGYYGIAAKFATISLLATTSILNIFWKEIAEAYSRHNYDMVNRIYTNTTAYLFFIGSVISLFMVPWSKEIIAISLGESYSGAQLPLLIMLFYPIHQSIGQINGSVFLATKMTKLSMLLSSSFMIVSIPITFIRIAPSNVIAVGKSFGSVGLAIKMVSIQIIAVNVQSYILKRKGIGNFGMAYQFGIIFILLLISYFSKYLTIRTLEYVAYPSSIIISIILAAVIYLLFIVFSLYAFRDILKDYIEPIKRKMMKVQIK